MSSILRRALAASACLLALAGPAAAQGALELAAPEAHRRASAGEITLIDIRRPDEWRQTGVAKNATRINMLHPGGADGFVKAVLESVRGDRNAPIALICRTGNRTAQVQKFLSGQGFGNVYHVPEGMVGSKAGPGWISRGLPVDPCKTC
jgi:rhodanese-related sulfurtransferase